MACVNIDGTVTSSARQILGAAREAAEPTAIAKAIGFPLFRIRSSLRELEAAGLVTETNGCYVITEAGLARIAEAAA